ncbi:MAG: hypothetical protein M3N31_08605 [Actinomycetota bacterium]|nr:hypothetical protein [Actinomycetota bacterium]
MFASLLSDVIEGRPVAASLVVSVTPAPEEGDGNLQALVERLRRSTGSEGGMARVEVVDLPAGAAVRLRRQMLAEADGAGAEGAVVETVQYFVPVPATASLLVLTFSTPNLPLAEAFVELFDTMAQTLHWRW